MHRVPSLSAVLLLCACADTALPPAGPDAGPLLEGPVAATRYCEEIAPFFCRFYLRCGRIAAADEAGCLDLFAESCEAKYEPRYAGLAAAGLLGLRREGLVACERHLDAVVCDAQVLDLDGPCAGMWEGRVPAGSACGFDLDSLVCAPGSRCVLGASLCGTCRSVAEDGAACGAGVPCAAVSRCSEGRCVARAALDGACEGFGDCLPGLSCSDATCRPPLRALVGEACGQGLRCPYAAACVEGTCHAQAREGAGCVPIPGCASGRCEGGLCSAPRAAGESCESSLECLSALCWEGRCDAIPGHCLVTD